MSKKLTLKEELEILRGEPIQVFTGDPLDIPCIETSDPERLCKHPVVSVHMITYNHEPYIRQAIEGVMMQKTDFEFELLIGEDCSTDKTREICFEYQKRYPEKIRVLWCDHNLYRNPHSAGGNSERNKAHCRGEFIAICEGDDYWIDPLKLQKQVDVMRKFPNVGLCFCDKKIINEMTHTEEHWGSVTVETGVRNGLNIVSWICCPNHNNKNGESFQIFTATTMIRASVYKKSRETFDIFGWRLALGDTTTWLGLAALSDGYYLADKVACYRRHAGGVSNSNRWHVMMDGIIVRSFFARIALNLQSSTIMDIFRDDYCAIIIERSLALNRRQQMQFIHDQFKVDAKKKCFRGVFFSGVKILLLHGVLRRWNYAIWFKTTHLPELLKHKFISCRKEFATGKAQDAEI